MNYKVDMNSIENCFGIILQGNKETSRLAARKVGKLLYSSLGDRNKYRNINNLIDTAPCEYTKIIEDWRQENFVVAVSVIYYLHNKEEQPDFLFPWLFQLLQHPNGTIRYAAVRMFSNEIGPLTVHIRFPGERSSCGGKLNVRKVNDILYSLFAELNKLLSVLWQPKYEKFKYINSLPVSPYKSVQMVLSELKESCGNKFF